MLLGKVFSARAMTSALVAIGAGLGVGASVGGAVGMTSGVVLGDGVAAKLGLTDGDTRDVELPQPATPTVRRASTAGRTTLRNIGTSW